MAVRGMGNVSFGAALCCPTKKNEMEFLCLVLFFILNQYFKMSIIALTTERIDDNNGFYATGSDESG